jgi:hypothetical protein
MYPSLRDDHLRLLERWGLIRPVAGRYSFADLHLIKQAVAELERGASVQAVVRAVEAERQGQLALDFQPARPERTPAKVVRCRSRRRRRPRCFRDRGIPTRPPPIRHWPPNTFWKAPSSTTARIAT